MKKIVSLLRAWHYRMLLRRYFLAETKKGVPPLKAQKIAQEKVAILILISCQKTWPKLVDYAWQPFAPETTSSSES